MRKVLAFLREVRAEMAKVVWPTRARALRLTLVVIVTTIIFGAFIAAVDFGFGKGIQYVLDTTQKKSTPAPQQVPGGDTGQVPVVPQSQPTP